MTTHIHRAKTCHPLGFLRVVDLEGRPYALDVLTKETIDGT